MDYFSEKSNPFYDRTCNNEIVKMQRMNLDQLKWVVLPHSFLTAQINVHIPSCSNMVGMEYILLHVQDPILYVIRKQHRHSPTEATPMADYYIIAGTIYQAPDLANVFNSRILALVNNLQGAFEEASGYARYHPSKGYSWDFTTNKAREFHFCTFLVINHWNGVNSSHPSPVSDKSKSQIKKDTASTKEESSSSFQRQRVDMLLGELVKKFPIPQITTATVKKEDPDATGEDKSNGPDADAIKQEKNDMRPPEKKMKFN